MANFPIHYTPEHLALGDTPVWVSATDGDTPTIQLPVRMLGIDAPELHFGGADESHPDKFDVAFTTFLTQAGATLDKGLKRHLVQRLKDKASTRQITAGKEASDHFKQMAEERLARTGKNGKPLKPRHLFAMVAEEVFDQHGRMLAYINATYTKEERAAIPPEKRYTFNLQMMQDGHATSLLIYPNCPKPTDLALVQKAVSHARTTKLGFWKQGAQTLLPYEFRWIIDTMNGKRQGPDRYCGDITTAQLYPPQKYYFVLPENRMFFFGADVSSAFQMGFKLVS